MNDYKLTKMRYIKLYSIIKGVTLSALRQIKRLIHQILSLFYNNQYAYFQQYY